MSAEIEGWAELTVLELNRNATKNCNIITFQNITFNLSIFAVRIGFKKVFLVELEASNVNIYMSKKCS